MATRSVKACSAYATRLIANGRVGGSSRRRTGSGDWWGTRSSAPPPPSTCVAGRRSAFSRRRAGTRARGKRRAWRRTIGFERTRRVARSSCASTNKAGSSLSSGGRAPPPRSERGSFRGAAEKALGFGSPRAASGIRKSASFTRFPPTYALREKNTRHAEDAEGEPTRDRRAARIGAVAPAPRCARSMATLGAAPRVGGEVWTPRPRAPPRRWAGGPGGTRRRPSPRRWSGGTSRACRGTSAARACARKTACVNSASGPPRRSCNFTDRHQKLPSQLNARTDAMSPAEGIGGEHPDVQLARRCGRQPRRRRAREARQRRSPRPRTERSSVRSARRM